MTNKYRNKKQTVYYNGKPHKFDSQGEAQYFAHLTTKLENKRINALTLQPEFVLQEKFYRKGKTIRAIKYRADFSYYIGKKHYVEDFKGVLTQVYKLKIKLFLKKFGDELTFHEVYLKRGRFVKHEL